MSYWDQNWVFHFVPIDLVFFCIAILGTVIYTYAEWKTEKEG